MISSLANRIECKCQEEQAAEHSASFAEFLELRDQCAALSELFIPNWQKYISSHQRLSRGERSVLLLARGRGCLGRITSPIHRYLLENGRIRHGVKEQYKKDLEEKWMLKSSEMERHRRRRGFMGKVVELMIAEWLERQGFHIQDLEALGANHDILVLAPNGNQCAIESKYIGVDDDFFRQVRVAEESNARHYDDEPAANYLLYRVCESALQLSSFAHKRIVVITISEDWGAHNKIRTALDTGAIDWRRPRFIPTSDRDWNVFAQRLQATLPTIQSNAQDLVGSLSNLWILWMSSRYRFEIGVELVGRSP